MGGEEEKGRIFFFFGMNGKHANAAARRSSRPNRFSQMPPPPKQKAAKRLRTLSEGVVSAACQPDKAIRHILANEEPQALDRGKGSDVRGAV